jgi:hypothetical protein
MRSGDRYLVADVNELERVWREGHIHYALIMKKDVFELLRGNVALRAIPELELA